MDEASEGHQLPNSLEQYRIQHVPESMYYIPNFISPEEEQSIADKIPQNKWVTLSKRRLQAIPSRLSATNTLLAAPLPDWLTRPVVDRIHDLEVFQGAPHGINHCLVNEYQPGQGIFPHEDGAAYHPIVATVSLGGSIVLEITPKPGDDELRTKPEPWRILQEPRSLLLTAGSAYTETLHGIAQVETDEGLGADTVTNWSLLGDAEAVVANGGRNERRTRVSLTCRDVKKVSNVGAKIFGRSRG